MSGYVTDPSLLAELNMPQGGGYVSDPALLAQLGGKPKPAPMSARVLKQTAAKMASEGSPWYERAAANVGAGADSIIQGTKQLIPGVKSMTDAELEEKRAIDEGLAENTGGGGALQLGGEILATAPVGMGVGKVLHKAMTKYAPKATQFGGRIFNARTATLGAGEGAATAALNPVTGDESRTLNTVAGGTLGAVLPLLLAGGAKGAKVLRNKYAGERAANKVAEHLGPQEVERVRAIVQDGQGNPTHLPLSTAATTDSELLGALERGSRRRDASWIRQQDAPVAARAWDWFQNATSKADDLGARKQSNEGILAAGKEYLDTAGTPQTLKDASDRLVREIDTLRNSPEGRVNPEFNRTLAEVEIAASNPNRSARDFSSQWFRLQDQIEGATNTEVKSALIKLQNEVATAADSASGGGGFSDMIGRYKAEQGLVNESTAHQAMRDTFQSPQGGVAKTGRVFDTPELTSTSLRKTLANVGEDKYGTLITGSDRSSIESLADELRRHEIYKGSASPGATSLESFDPMGVLATGRDNPVYLLPGLRGLINATFGRADKATLKVVDDALRSPDAYRAMLAAKEAAGQPLSKTERGVRQILLKSSSALGGAISGD